jgi:hypothetical protein
MFTITERFRLLAPQAHIGLLEMSAVSNPAQNELLEQLNKT